LTATVEDLLPVPDAAISDASTPLHKSNIRWLSGVCWPWKVSP